MVCSRGDRMNLCVVKSTLYVCVKLCKQKTHRALTTRNTLKVKMTISNFDPHHCINIHSISVVIRRIQQIVLEITFSQLFRILLRFVQIGKSHIKSNIIIICLLDDDDDGSDEQSEFLFLSFSTTIYKSMICIRK